MSKRRKRLERIRQNPKNVSLDDLQRVLQDYGFEHKQIVGSHYTFSYQLGGETKLYVVPFKRPVKPISVNHGFVMHNAPSPLNPLSHVNGSRGLYSLLPACVGEG